MFEPIYVGPNNIISIPKGWKMLTREEKQASDFSVKTESFLRYFHAQPGIDPAYTLTPFVQWLFEAVEVQGRVQLVQNARQSGITTLILAFIDWYYFNSGNHSLFITSSPSQFIDRKRPWRLCKSPFGSFRGLQPKPRLVLIDDPLSHAERMSAVSCRRYEHEVQRLGYFNGPVLEVIRG